MEKRVIKFRAWDKTKNKWAHDIITNLHGGIFEFIYGEEPGDGDYKETSNIELMQFTGLHDRNGKEIYEGDVVKRYHLQGVVAWHKERAMFIVNDGFNEPVFNDILGIEVICNLYENPELLNQ